MLLTSQNVKPQSCVLVGAIKTDDGDWKWKDNNSTVIFGVVTEDKNNKDKLCSCVSPTTYKLSAMACSKPISHYMCTVPIAGNFYLK